MSVVIEISAPLLEFTEEAKTVTVNGNTVKECLTDLAGIYPMMSDYLFDRTGTLKTVVVLGGAVVPQKSLDMAVSPGDHLTLLLPVDGG